MCAGSRSSVSAASRTDGCVTSLGPSPSALGRGTFCLAQEPVWIQNAILPAASAKERSRYGQQEQPAEAGIASAAPGGLFLLGFRLGLLLLHGLQEDSLVAQADGPLAVPPDLSRSC